MLHCRINVVESAVKVEDKYEVVNYLLTGVRLRTSTSAQSLVGKRT